MLFYFLQKARVSYRMLRIVIIFFMDIHSWVIPCSENVKTLPMLHILFVWQACKHGTYTLPQRFVIVGHIRYCRGS